MNTNSNTYTIVYSAVIVVVVAFLLAFVSQTLKPQQDANVAVDKQKQLLYALNQDHNISNEQAASLYKQLVVADDVIDANGKVTENGTPGGTDHGFKLNSADAKAGKLALYRCKVDGKDKYIIPVYGMGLWGGISGYIAINEDKATVYGAYFNHEGETAGLGAEIKDNANWQKMFQGKHLFKEGQTGIALSVSKKVSDPNTEVDAVTGATLTSNGVSEMLHEGLAPYVKFLNEK